MTKERREEWRRQCADAIASDNDLGESMGVIVPAGTLRALLDSDERLEAMDEAAKNLMRPFSTEDLADLDEACAQPCSQTSDQD